MGTEELILGAALVLIASYCFNILSAKTRIPSVLMLMILGFGIQQFANFEQEQVLQYLPPLGVIGVILIVLEATLDLKLTRDNRPIIGKSLVLAAVGLLLTSGLIALFLVLILQMPFYNAMLYAVPLATLSSAIIIPSVAKLSQHKKEFLIFESSFSDILGIILFYALLSANHSEAGMMAVPSELGKILLSIVLSLVISYGLITLFQYVTKGARLILLIAILMALYALGKLLHLAPLILIMVFGLMLNNRELFFRGRLDSLVKEDAFEDILHQLHTITLEAAFFVRTLFFVVFGMSIVLSQLFHWTVPVISLLVLAAIYGVRWAGLKVLYKKTESIMPEWLVAPRGLITVLLFYKIIPELQVESFQPGILLLTILVSSVLMTYGLIRTKAKPEQPEVTSEAEAAEETPNTTIAEGEPPQEAPLEVVAEQSLSTPSKEPDLLLDQQPEEDV